MTVIINSHLSRNALCCTYNGAIENCNILVINIVFGYLHIDIICILLKNLLFFILVYPYSLLYACTQTQITRCAELIFNSLSAELMGQRICLEQQVRIYWDRDASHCPCRLRRHRNDEHACVHAAVCPSLSTIIWKCNRAIHLKPWWADLSSVIVKTFGN